MDTTTDNMISLQPMDATTERNWPSTITSLLVAATIVVVALTLLGILAGAILVNLGSPWAARLMAQLGWILSGLAAATLCGAVVFLVHLQRAALSQARSANQRLAALADHTLAQATARVTETRPNPELLEVRRLLVDMREIMLMPEEQRQARFRNMMQAELRRRVTLANQYIDAREFHRAREELASLADRFGRTDDLHRLEERLVEATRAALAEDIETATRKISDLMTMTRWEQAEQYARELTQKYPDSSEPRKLLARVQEERGLFDRRHRQRMHDEIQQFVNQRRWREAAGAAEQFIQTFPTGVDTDALRQQLETLKANAEIEIRQQLERHIKEYVASKDYWGALELARRIIAEYPSSPQANILRTQLPRLEDLARQQGPRA